jgi:enamine deaminase RidA (YjgF/YER057c/UK114 family)
MTRRDIQPESLPDPRPRYTHGIHAEGSLIFIAGQVAVDRENNVVGKGDAEKQAEQVFENIRAVLTAAGASFENLVMTTTYLTDITYREAFNKVRVRYYGKTPPTNTLLVVQALANPDYLIEISGMAVI